MVVDCWFRFFGAAPPYRVSCDAAATFGTAVGVARRQATRLVLLLAPLRRRRRSLRDAIAVWPCADRTRCFARCVVCTDSSVRLWWCLAMDAMQTVDDENDCARDASMMVRRMSAIDRYRIRMQMDMTRLHGPTAKCVCAKCTVSIFS